MGKHQPFLLRNYHSTPFIAVPHFLITLRLDCLSSTRNISLQRQSNYASTSSDFTDIALSSSDTIISYPWGEFDSIAHRYLRHWPPSITACTDAIVTTRLLSQSVISTPPHCNRDIFTPHVHHENFTAKSAQILRRFFH